jgi:hypothetical protein
MKSNGCYRKCYYTKVWNSAVVPKNWTMC